MSEEHQQIRIFISGACAGLAEARDSLAGHPDIQLVGTASDPTKAGSKFASSGAQVVLHALHRPDSLPTDEIEKIREHTSAPIVLLVSRSSSTLLDEAVTLGVSDVALLPQSVDNLVFAVKKAQSIGASMSAASSQRRVGDTCRVVTVFSPKGGVGKTVVATNLATTFAKRLRQRTLLLDLDLQFGDAALMLGSDPRATILDLVMSSGDLDSDKLAGYVTHHESGLHILPAPLRPEDAELVTEDRLAALLTAARQAYDVIVIDTAPSFTPTMLAALDRTDELLIVGSLEATSLKSVKVCLQTLAMLHFPLETAHVLLNRSDTKVGLTKDQVERSLGTSIRFGIPSSKLVPTSVNRGVPVVLTDPKSDVARAVQQLCLALIGDAEQQSAKTAGERLSRRDRRRAATAARRLAESNGAATRDDVEDTRPRRASDESTTDFDFDVAA